MIIKNKSQIKLILALRLRQLNENGVKGISYDELEYIFIHYIWKNTSFLYLNKYVDSIFSTSDDDIIKWMTIDSKVQGSHKSISEALYELEIV